MQLPCGRHRVQIPAEADIKLCGCREFSDYVSFRRAVKRQRFHILNTHDTKSRTIQQHSLQMPYTLELYLGPFPPDIIRLFPPEWPMAPFVVCLRETGFLLQVTYDPLYDMIPRYHPLGCKWILNHNKINNPRHSLLSWTILLFCLASTPLFF